ncbi:hypothetical protein HY992_00535 [Candidatus Micrarchaeota archaeon]|nr:hypothetical protein [Candidatus Micrarchaeota archaeon]
MKKKQPLNKAKQVSLKQQAEKTKQAFLKQKQAGKTRHALLKQKEKQANVEGRIISRKKTPVPAAASAQHPVSSHYQEQKKRFCPFLTKAILFALLCVALLAAYLFYTNFLQRTTFSGESFSGTPSLLPQKKSECSAGMQKNCSTSSNCYGVSVCANGEWSACIVKKTCVPGSVKVCPLQGGCGYGQQTCNECGTGYSECE